MPFEQKTNFTGKVGEDVLILEKRENGWAFTSHHQIANIETKNLETGYKLITVTLQPVQQFNDEKLLEDYIYSLKRIYNYANPIKHFNRKYSRLFDPEFDAIVEDKIYLKRTIVGTILNSLHRSHQEAFISYLAIESPDLLIGHEQMDEVLKLLLDYLQFAIIKPAQYLKESAEILNSIIPPEDFAAIGFGPAVESNSIKIKDTQLIAPQILIIDEHLSYLLDFNNQKLGLQFLELRENPGFKKLFKNTPLPITLN